MSIRDDFSEDEWFLLSSTPAMIGAAMSSAAPSGVIGTVKEMTAGMRGTVQGLNDYPDSELITTLLEKAQNWDEAKDKMQDYREKAKARLDGASIKYVAIAKAFCAGILFERSGNTSRTFVFSLSF